MYIFGVFIQCINDLWAFDWHHFQPNTNTLNVSYRCCSNSSSFILVFIVLKLFNWTMECICSNLIVFDFPIHRFFFAFLLKFFFLSKKNVCSCLKKTVLLFAKKQKRKNFFFSTFVKTFDKKIPLLSTHFLFQQPFYLMSSCDVLRICKIVIFNSNNNNNKKQQ